MVRRQPISGLAVKNSQVTFNKTNNKEIIYRYQDISVLPLIEFYLDIGGSTLKAFIHVSSS